MTDFVLQKFSGGDMDLGIQVFTSDLAPNLAFDWETWNVTHGFYRGTGPREGMAIIPGQASTFGSGPPGLQLAEQASGTGGFTNRILVLGMFSVVMGTGQNITVRKPLYGVIVVGNLGLNVHLLSSAGPSATFLATPAIQGGIPTQSITQMGTSLGMLLNELIPPDATGSRTTAQTALLSYTSGQFYCSYDVFSVSGQNVPMQWLAARVIAQGDGTHAPNLNFWRDTVLEGGIGDTVAQVHALGPASQINDTTFSAKARTLTVYALNIKGQRNLEYSVLFPTPSNVNTYHSQPIFNETTSMLTLSGLLASKVEGPGVFTNTKFALLNDSEMATSSGYKAICIAAKKAYIVLMQDWGLASDGTSPQYVDIVSDPLKPPTIQSNYTEDASSKNTCFAGWPYFVPGTAMAGGAYPNNPFLGAAGTGVLRLNTVYEFTFSYYNKRLDYETNVGVPVKIQTGTADAVNIRFYVNGANQTFYSDTMLENWGILPYPASNFNFGSYVSQLHDINYLEYRFYYRISGSFEWIPAGRIDAAQLWFQSTSVDFSVCSGTAAGSTGGQPGGFNDYSPLPNDQWTCVVQYKQRAFWLSDKQLIFSLRDNLLVYAGRNSFSASGGDYRGALVHNYPGQAEQSSRLIVFTTKGTYVGRFTGNLSQLPVQIDSNTSGIFDIDGSDFVLDPWTSVTAFSQRTAVVAEGILYWWGPQGIYRDDGVATPTKISLELEPNIFNDYDPAHLDVMQCSYNATTKEITWTYLPNAMLNETVFQTYGLTYSTTSGKFYRRKYPMLVDWVAPLDVANNLTFSPAYGAAGHRQVIGSRATSGGIQRAYYHDTKCRAGDMALGTDYFVQLVDTPTPGTKRLTFAAGSSSLGAINVGDYIALQGVQNYTGVLTSDLLAKVTDRTSSTVSFLLPTGAVLDDVALPLTQYFPAYFWSADATDPSLFAPNGINYQAKSNYWLAGGANGWFFWLWIYMLSKIRLWKSDVPFGPTIEYRTPTADGLIGDQLVLEDNSDGNWQLYHQLRTGDDNHEGQALRFILSGTHLAHEWVLQYLELHATPQDKDGLRTFER